MTKQKFFIILLFYFFNNSANLEGYESAEKVLASLKEYKNTGNKYKITSTQLSDRIFPQYSSSEMDLQDKQFVETVFEGNASGETVIKKVGSVINPNLSGINKYKINESEQGIRNKLPIELGLCVPIKQPRCSSVTEKGALWEEAKFASTIIIGKCLLKTENPPKRLCQLKRNNFNVAEWSEIIGACKFKWWPDPEDSGDKLYFPDIEKKEKEEDYIKYHLKMTNNIWMALVDSSTESDLYKSLKDKNETKFKLNLNNILNIPELQIYYSSAKDKESFINFKEYMTTNCNLKPLEILIFRKDVNLCIEISINGISIEKQEFKDIFSKKNIEKNALYE